MANLGPADSLRPPLPCRLRFFLLSKAIRVAEEAKMRAQRGDTAIPRGVQTIDVDGMQVGVAGVGNIQVLEEEVPEEVKRRFAERQAPGRRHR